jgi:hypothetical protein
MRYKTPYEIPRRLRSCLNCVHLDQPAGNIAGKEVGACRQRLMKYGWAKDDPRFGKTCCGQWFLRPLDDSDYD